MMHRLVKAILALVPLAVLLFAVVDAPRIGAERPVVRGPTAGPRVIPASSDKGLRALAQAAPTERIEMPAPKRLPRPSGSAQQSSRADSIRQTFVPTTNMPAPSKSFEGLYLSAWGSGWPPDPNGDVGPDHYVQTVNTSVGVFTKAGALLSAVTFDTLFDGTGTPCDYHNQGDPVVIYDHLADRWVVSDMGGLSRQTGPSYECIAVSKTSDPVAGGWWFYALQVDATLLNDYPKLALWPDGYYLTTNLFSGSGSMVSNRLWALNRDAMLNGQPFTPLYFELDCQYFCYSTVLPGNLKGTRPPAGAPAIFGAIFEPNRFDLWRLHPDWTNLLQSTIDGPEMLGVANFVMPCFAANVFACVPELGGESVDGLGDRLMMQLQYRNIGGTQSLWATHTVADGNGVGIPTGVRWYEIRDPNGNPSVYQQGTWQPDSKYRWMPSLAVDRSGNMAIGYSVSSSTQYPAIRYAGRLVTDPRGILGRGETSLIEGTGSQSGGFNRWGDYTDMTVDPSDDCTFWYTDEYYATTGRDWHTRIGSFRFPSCGASASAASATPVPPPARIEDAYEPDEYCDQGHTITNPELHNFHSPKDQDWVKFMAKAGWVYHIKAAPRPNFPTEPHLDLYVGGNLIASNDHYFGNTAEIWWWNQNGDRQACVRVTELKGRADAGNSEYTLSVDGTKDKP